MGEGRTRSHGPRTAPSRRLAAIMFTDVVGYSALSQRDERLALELLELHRVWVRELLAQGHGREIATIGDAFLVEFTGALAAVECALAIQRRFNAYNAGAEAARRIVLRVGIHLADVEFRDNNVLGDGVNLASRIHGEAEPGGICVSEQVHAAVRNRPEFRFRSLGRPKMKNIAVPLELFSLDTGAPAGASAAGVARGAARRLVPAVLAVLALATLAALAIVALRPNGPPPAEVPSLAVLPFDNLSADPDSAFFTDGLHDSVIGHLSRVAGLKVISRTSVMRYRGQPPNLREIAGELGVTSIVEGSVQRAGSKLRVVAQLIDAATDTHLWSSEYDRDMADVFAVQADIAQQVASAVKVKLTPQEQALIKAVPTRNPAAYDLYLRALMVDRSSELDRAKAAQAIDWLQQAIALDPGFAPAHALLAKTHDFLHWFGYDNSDERRRLVGVNAAKALSLDPNSVEAHIAMALEHYHGSRNYDAAITELEAARGLAPNDASVQFWLGVIHRRQGRWDDAQARIERATSLDPLNSNYLYDYGQTLQLTRRYADAARAYQRLAHAQEGETIGPTLIAHNHFLQSGDLAGLDRALAALPADYDPGCSVSWLRYFSVLYKRRYADAAAAASACKERSFPGDGSEMVPPDYLVARAQWLGGDRRTPALAPKLRDQFERSLAAKPDQPYTRTFLAFTRVMLGEPARALEEVERGLAAMPPGRDALARSYLLLWAAEVHANAGDPERALRELTEALGSPGGSNLEEVRLDPIFDPLRKDPRFQKMLDAHQPRRT